jgi:Na+/H+-dicarboxylate symporter
VNLGSFDWIAAAALVTVLLLFGVLFILRRKRLDFTLTVLVALAMGVAIGIVFSGHTDWITPLGKIYVTLLSAIVMPLILVSILSSVTSLESIDQLKGIGLRSLFWLLFTTFAGIILSLGLGMTFGIGRGAHLTVDGVSAETFKTAVTPFSQVLVSFFPRNPISDFAEEKIIPIILFAVLIGVSYVLVAHKDAPKVASFKSLIEAGKAITFKAVDFIIELTPYAVLALVATSTSNGLTRSGMIWSLLALLVLTFIALAIDTWGLNYVFLRAFAHIKPLAFFKKILPAQVTAFSTQSSSGTLPLTTGILTGKIGVSPDVANFTAPLGTTIGMPGCSAIWPVLVAIYGINGLGLSYGLSDWLLLGFVSLFVSMGTAGVPGTATVVTASVLTAAGLPVEILVLVIPISAIADTGRTACNVTAAATAATIVARQTGQLDTDVLYDRVGAPAGAAQDAADDATAVLPRVPTDEGTHSPQGEQPPTWAPDAGAPAPVPLYAVEVGESCKI